MLIERDLTLHLPGFTVRTTKRRGGTTLPPHAHETTNIGLCVAGSYLETVGRSVVSVTPPTLVARPAGESHENRYRATTTRCIIIELHPPALASIRDATSILDRTFVHESTLVATTAQRMDRELRQRDDVTPLIVESLVQELVADAHRSVRRSSTRLRAERPRRPQWFERAVELLHETMRAGATIGLSELAAQVEIHPSQLARAFRREFGCAVGEHLRSVRLERASALLRTTRLELAEVAHVTGYSDQSHLCTAFRRHFGVTPGRFRRALRT